MKEYLTRILAPAKTPVAINDLKKHLRLREDDTAEDAYLTSILNAATGFIDGRDGWLGRCLISQKWRMVLDYFPDKIIIPLPPLISVDSITYIDSDGDTQTISSANYRVVSDIEPAIIEPVEGYSWPTPDCIDAAVRVNFTAGYGTDAASVPDMIRHYIKIVCGDMYANRESIVIGTIASRLEHIADMLENFRIRGATNARRSP